MKKFNIIAFDIDGTLTQSKLPLDEEMAELICQLIKQYKVAIISGASYEQFKWQIVSKLHCDSRYLENLYLLPVDGTVFCYRRNGWQCQHDAPLSHEEKERIKTAFENIFKKSGLESPDKIYGELVEDRGAQLNFSALGQEAPTELKEKWDPDNKKRVRIIKALKNILPNFSMHIGGTTSIEITRAGIDKAYGLNKLMEQTGISREQMLYVGDKLFKGGNDEPVIGLGLQYHAVNNLSETKRVIMQLIKNEYGRV